MPVAPQRNFPVPGRGLLGLLTAVYELSRDLDARPKPPIGMGQQRSRERAPCANSPPPFCFGVAVLAHDASTGPAGAQSFDCAQAGTAIEKAICASPALRDADARLARSYQAVLVQDPARAADATRAQRQWLAERDRTCSPRPPAQAPGPQSPNAPARGTPVDPGVIVCLDQQYRGRLGSLDAEAARSLSASLPVLRDPAARLSRDTVGSGDQGDVLLQVSAPGRFAIRAESATGTALQLVDMIEGPGEIAGDAGARDGRLDVLLDVGTYKVRTFRAPKATGETKISVLPFRDAEPPGRGLLHGGELSTALTDLQQRSFWIAVRKPGKSRSKPPDGPWAI